MSTKNHTKRPPEAAQGRYFALPHNVLDSDAWRRCSPHARALLMDLCRQHSGSNNGCLHLSRSWIEARGWTRPATTKRLIDELIENRLIVQTRHGGLRNGSHQYALSWLAISNFVGLEVTARDYHPGAYLLPPIPPRPAPGKNQNGRTPHVLEKAAARTPHVLEAKHPRTPHVPKSSVSGKSPRTPHVHHEYNQSMPAQIQGRGAPGTPPRTIDPWTAFHNARRFDMARFRLAGNGFEIDRADHSHHNLLAGDLCHATH